MNIGVKYCEENAPTSVSTLKASSFPIASSRVNDIRKARSTKIKMILQILEQIQTKRHLFEPKECEDTDTISESVRELGLDHEDIGEIRRQTQTNKMVFIHVELEHGEKWLALTTYDLKTKLVPFQYLSNAIANILFDKHVIKIVKDVKFTRSKLAEHGVKLRNYVDIDEVESLNQQAKNPEAEVETDVGVVARKMFGWNFESYVSEHQYIQTNVSLPPKWKKFPEQRRLKSIHRDGMYNIVRFSIIHNVNLLSFFILERAVEMAIICAGMEIKRKDNLKSLVLQILEPLRTFQVDGIETRPYGNTVFDHRAERERIRESRRSDNDGVLVIKTSKRDYAALLGEPRKLGTLQESDDEDGNDISECEDDPLDNSGLVDPDTVVSERLVELSTSSESESENPEIVVTGPTEIKVKDPPKLPSKNKLKKRWTRQQKRQRKLAELQCESVPKKVKKKLSEAERRRREISPSPAADYYDKPLVDDKTPMHLRNSVSFDNVCTFCGGSGKDFHLRRNCSVYRKQKQRREEKKPPKLLCRYPLCSDRYNHCLPVCYQMHERCYGCGGRGHYEYQCKSKNQDEFRRIYELFRPFGHFSAIAHKNWAYK